MLGTKQVVNRLNWIECFDRDFDKDCIPIAHCTVPETGELEGTQFASALRLGRDESRLGINVLEEVEGLAVLIAYCTNQIYGIEVGCTLHNFHRHRVLGINLDTFQNLGLEGAVGTLSDIWTASGLALILHHTADSQRPVEFGLDIDSEFAVFKQLGVGILHAERSLEEVEDFLLSTETRGRSLHP